MSVQIRMGAKLCTALSGVDELIQHGVAHDQLTIFEKCARGLSRAVRPGAVKNYPMLFLINTVYEEPVRLNVTFPPVFIFSVQQVIFMLWQ